MDPNASRAVVVQSCASCGKSLDMLRAAAVLCFEDGFRYFCEPDCRVRFQNGERPSGAYARGGRASVRPGPIEAKPVPQLLVEAERPLALFLQSEDLHGNRTPDRMLMGGVLLATAAGIIGAFHTTNYLLVLSAVLSLTSSSVALHAAWHPPLASRFSSLAGPFGAMCVAVSAFGLAAGSSSAKWTLAGASLIACVMLLRCLIQRDGTTLVLERLQKLLVPLPLSVHVPAETDSGLTRLPRATVPVDGLRTGEEVVIAPGETVPVDGVISAGHGSVVPFPNAGSAIALGVGDSIMAGAQLIDGALRIVITNTGPQRVMIRALQLRSPDETAAGWLYNLHRLLRRWAGTVLLGLCLVAFATHTGVANRLQAVGIVLVVVPLLALDRSIYLTLLAAAISAADRGVFFKGRRSLFRAGAVSIVALRSRGIATEGRLDVVELKTFGSESADSILSLVVSAEEPFSGHPIANALLRFAASRGVTFKTPLSSSLREGHGIVGSTHQGEPFVIGNRQLLLNRGVSIALAEDELRQAEALGRTAVLVAVNDRVQAMFSFQDEPSPHARVAVQRLVDMDMEVVLLSGDHRRTVETIASHLGIDHVKADLPSEERAQEVRRLRDAGNVVSIIGTPVQDEQQLAASDIPIILASAGRGLNISDAVVLVSKDLRDAADALWIAKATRRTIRRAIVVVSTGGVLCCIAALFGQLSAVGAAFFALVLDLYALPKAHRLLRRIDLRLPLRTW